MVRCRYSSEFIWTICMHETVVLRLPYHTENRMSFCTLKPQNAKFTQAQTLSVYITCNFSFLFLLVQQKWYEWIEGAQCVYSCIYKDAIDPYFSTRFFSLVCSLVRWLLHRITVWCKISIQFFLIQCLISIFLCSCCSSIFHVVSSF